MNNSHEAWRERRDEMSDELSKFDQAVEAATQFERDEWLKLLDKYNQQQDKLRQVERDAVALMRAIVDAEATLGHDLYKNMVHNAITTLQDAMHDFDQYMPEGGD